MGRAFWRLSGGGLRIAGLSWGAGDGAFVVMVGRAVSNESAFSSAGVTGAVWFDGI